MFLEHPFYCTCSICYFLTKKSIADAIPERKGTIAYEADTLLRYLATNGYEVADRMVDMIQSEQQILFLARINIAVMMFRKYQG
ncbi:hypothetical protein D3C77_338110 [compost metagenome]